MGQGIPPSFQLERYGVAPEDVVRCWLRCDSAAVERRTVVMPTWRPAVYATVAERIEEVVPGILYRLQYRGQAFSLVRPGMGAPAAGEAVLALGCTACDTIIFAGSAGGLDCAMGIGDLVLPERSLSGDGFSRYLAPGAEPADCFLQSAAPDAAVAEALRERAQARCAREALPLHAGAVYSTDSILGQFSRLEHIAHGLGCIAIEMETAAAFAAAVLVGIRAGALLQVSDLPLVGKSLFCGRSDEEMARRAAVRERVLARVILDTLASL